MHSFKQYLKESNTKFYPWQAKSNEELLQFPGWRKAANEKNCVFIDENTGEVYIEGFIDQAGLFNITTEWPWIVNEWLVEYQGKFYLPFNLKEWIDKGNQNDLRLANLKLSSFIGFPEVISNSLYIEDCPNLSPQGCPKKIKEIFKWDKCPITHNMHNYISECKVIFVGESYTGYLSFLKINNLKAIELASVFTFASMKTNTIAKKACEIINKYLKGNKDVWKCQDQLQDADLDDYADF